LDEKDGRSERRFRRTNEPFSDHTINVVLEELQLCLRHIVDGAKNGFCVGDEWDLMVDPRTVGRELLGVLGLENICKLCILYRDRSRQVVR
jgi:hypothetical protein